MKPIFQIIANGNDITQQINDRLLSLETSDEAGLSADAIEINLDDRDGLIALPPAGATLKASLGYASKGLTYMGAYETDEITINITPKTIKITGKSADMAGTIKQPKTRNWDNITIADIVAKIASEHGFTPAVDPAKGAFLYKQLAQTTESDMHLLTRIGRDHDALAGVKDGKLIFAAKGTGTSVSGAALPIVEIKPGQVNRATVTLAGRAKYSSVSAPVHDKKKAVKKDVLVGEGEPIYRIRHVYATEEEAQKAAQAKLDALSRGRNTLSVAIGGNPALIADMQLRMVGFREGANGLWSIKSVKHRISKSGYSCDIEAETPTGADDEESEAGDTAEPSS